MADPDEPITHSPLSQSVTRDGKTVLIEIYEDGEGGWLLEVIDEYGTSSVWDDPFATDEEALADALKTIDEDGIDSLIVRPVTGEKMTASDHALSDSEIDELDEFLADEIREETSMDVSTLEGFLAAVVMGPRMVPPSEWLPWIWDMQEGQADAEFANKEQANRVTSLIMRYYSGVNRTFEIDPVSFEPIFWRGAQWGAAEWCEGFILGFQFNDNEWSALANEHPEWFTAFTHLGAEDGIEVLNNEGVVGKWMDEIEPSLVSIYSYWDEVRGSQLPGLMEGGFDFVGQSGIEQVVRNGPKIGRNDPCPCGSGKKFKKCCGADGAPSTLH